MEKDRRILIITFAFPPIVGGGVFRTLKITSRLVKNGFKPTILSVKPVKLLQIDKKLEKLIPQGISIKRTYYPTIFNRILQLLKWKVFVPDDYIFWIPFALRAAQELLHKEHYDMIIASGPPFTTFLIGFLIKIHTKIPLVLEYRDPWIPDFYGTKSLAIYHWVSKFLEKIILGYADRIITISSALKNLLITQYSLQNRSRHIFSVPSGIDLKEFENIISDPPKPKVLTISIVSSIYGKRNPNLLFKLVKSMKEEGVFNHIKIAINIYGPVGNKTTLLNAIKKYGISEQVRYCGYVQHEKALSIIKNSNLNLDLSEIDIDYPSLPYHVWEYIACGNKVLFLGKQDSYKARFITQNNLGYVLPLDKPKEAQELLKTLIRKFQDGSLEMKNDIDSIKQFSWEKRVEKIIKILKTL